MQPVGSQPHNKLIGTRAESTIAVLLLLPLHRITNPRFWKVRPPVWENCTRYSRSLVPNILATYLGHLHLWNLLSLLMLQCFDRPPHFVVSLCTQVTVQQSLFVIEFLIGIASIRNVFISALIQKTWSDSSWNGCFTHVGADQAISGLSLVSRTG